MVYLLNMLCPLVYSWYSIHTTASLWWQFIYHINNIFLSYFIETKLM